MHDTQLDETVQLAVEAADRARAITMRLFRDPDLGVESKSYRSYVTDADRSAELAIRELLRDARPDDGIIGEEWNDVPSANGITWTLDPIDGTMSFVHGVPAWSTLIGVADSDGPLVGIIDVPAVGTRAVAARNRGCLVDGSPVRTSDRLEVAEATMLTSGLGDYWTPAALDRLITSGAIVRTWADGGWGYLLLAEGRVDVMADMHLNTWDYAPALCVVPEAGGQVSILRDGDVFTCVASNTPLHEPVLRLLDL